MTTTLEEQSLKISHGPAFGWMPRIFGIAIGVIAIAMITSGEILNLVLSPALMLIGILAGFSTTGVIIDPIHQRVRPYANYILFKSGKWISMKNYPNVVVLKTRTRRTIGNRATSTQIVDFVQNIYLMDAELRRKIFLRSYKEDQREKALKEASRLADSMDKKLVKYRPPRKSSNRRR